MVWARVVPCPFWWWGLFGDEAVGKEAVVLVVANNEVIEVVDVEDVAGLDEFGGYFFVGSAGFGVAGWVVVDDHDGARALTLKFALPVLRQGSLPLFREHRGYHSVSDIQRIVNGEKKLLQQ